MDTADSNQPTNPGAQGLARISTSGPLVQPTFPAGSPRGANPGQASPGLNLNPRMVWRAVLRHWWQALALWVLATAAGGALVWMKYKPEYEASGILKIEPAKTSVFARNQTIDSNYMSTQVQLITSPSVLLTVAVDPAVQGLPSIAAAPDAEIQLRKMINVAIPAGFLIRVSARSENRAEPAVIVNAVMKHYKKADGEWTSSQTSPLIENLEEYKLGLEAEIDELIVKVKEHAKLGQVDLDQLKKGLEPGDGDGEGSQRDGGESKYSLSIQEYARIRHDLIDLDFQIVQAQGVLDLERRRSEAVDPTQYIDQVVKNLFLEDREVVEVTRRLHEVETLLADHERRIRKGTDPTLTGLRNRQTNLIDEYNWLWEQRKGRYREMAEAQAMSPDKGLVAAQENLVQLELKKTKMQQVLESLEIDQRALSADTVEFSLNSQQLDHLQTLKRQIELQLRQLNFDQLAGGQIIEVSPAREIGIPTMNKRTKMLAVVPLAMLGLVVGLCTLLEMKAGRVGSPDELSARVPVEVFAVPPLPVVRPSRSLKATRSNDMQFELFVQQLDHLRVALCGEATSHPGRGRCVLITSATGGEGKTTLAAQLAVRCAEAGASTVLIDADLRRATLGKLFEVPECPGLSDVLRGEANLEDALVAISQVGGCQLLPAGSPEPNPNRILRGQRFGPMIEQLRRTFDVIIIDTSPVLPVPDALIMGRYTDGVVLAARHDRSRFPLVERANQLLSGAGVPVLGVVINGVRPSGMRYGDYTYSSYRSERGPAAADDEAVRGRVG